MTHSTHLVPELPILLVDDEEHVLDITRMTLRGKGLTNIIMLNDSRKVMPFLDSAQQPAALVMLDLMMPHLSGTELLPKIVSAFPQLPVIIMTSLYDLEAAVACMKSGAFDYLIKPVDESRLVSTVNKALKIEAMAGEIASLKKKLLSDELEHPAAFSEIITCNSQMQRLFSYVEVIARSSEPILITGETGVGKDLFAQSIHQASGLKGEFVSVNIAGLDDVMFSDTLFGHSKGAFTGASIHREGLIAKAAGGTLFLDEIGDLDESSQVKLLRLIHQGEYYPVGSDTIRKVFTHIVVATNQDLDERVASGRFRRDLYYRLCSHHMHIPPLRERPEDIPLLFKYFLRLAVQAFCSQMPQVAPEISLRISSCHFPGNVRELRALVFDAMARCQDGHLSLEHFPLLTNAAPTPTASELSPVRDGSMLISMFGRFPTISEMEEFMIAEALKLSGNNQTGAAALLDISRPTLNKRIHRSEFNE
jgi:two-component system response regulator HydG